MTTIVATVDAEKQFQEKMQERMRQAMGDLMPDAVLSQIIAKGIEEAFFKKRVKTSSSSWGRDEEYDSWFVEFLKKETKEQVEKAVKKWIFENSERVAKILEDVLSQGIGSAVIVAFNNIFQEQFANIKDSFRHGLSQLTLDNTNV